MHPKGSLLGKVTLYLLLMFLCGLAQGQPAAAAIVTDALHSGFNGYRIYLAEQKVDQRQKLLLQRCGGLIIPLQRRLTHNLCFGGVNIGKNRYNPAAAGCYTWHDLIVIAGPDEKIRSASGLDS